MKIRWYGHACFEISDRITIVTDPHDGKSLGIKPPVVKADLVLVSHDHFDHNCTRIVKAKDLEIVKELGSRRIKGVEINGIKTYHDDSLGEKRGGNIVFTFALNDISFCHLGDLGHRLDEKKAKEIGKVDVIFIPVGGTFTISGREAWEVIRMLKPRVIVPMHYRIAGLSIPISPLESFLENAGSVPINRVGNEIDFESEDLPDESEIWVFTL